MFVCLFGNIFTPARKINFTKSKQMETTKFKDYIIEIPLPYSAMRNIKLKEKLGSILLAFNKDAYDKYGDILKANTSKDSMVNTCAMESKKKEYLTPNKKGIKQMINLTKKDLNPNIHKPVFASLHMEKGKCFVTMFTYDPKITLKVSGRHYHT